MKREDLRAIEGLSEAQVDAVMTLAGRDSAAAHSREEALRLTWHPHSSRSSSCRPSLLSRPQITASAILPGTLRRMRGRSMRMM